MSVFLAALFAIAINLALFVLDYLVGGRIMATLYGWIGLPAQPNSLIRFMVIGGLHLLPYSILVTFFTIEMKILVEQPEHFGRRAVEWIERTIGNHQETWPPILLGPASALHLAALYPVLWQGKIHPLAWWSAFLMLSGLWGLYFFKLPAPEKKADEEKVKKGISAAAEMVTVPRLPVAKLLGLQTWFHHQINFQLPWVGEIPSDAPAAWQKAARRAEFRKDVFGSRNAGRFLRKAAVAETIGAIVRAGGNTAGPTLPAGKGGDESKPGVYPDPVKLYSHQERVMNLLEKDSLAPEKPMHVILATPTGSGRTTVGCLSTLDCIFRKHQTVLIVYPNPQIGRILYQQLVDAVQNADWQWSLIMAERWSDRALIEWKGRAPSEINPDIIIPDLIAVDVEALHQYILPGHAQWARYFEQIGLIVVESLDSYVGVWGANASMVFSRLMRIAKCYRAVPQILAFALRTKGLENFVEKFFALDPDELSNRQIVEEDGRGAVEKHIVFWNPQINENAASSLEANRSNFVLQINAILATLAEAGMKPVLLSKSIPLCESDISATNQAVIQRMQAKMRSEVDFAIGNAMDATYTYQQQRLHQATPAEFHAAVVTGLPGSFYHVMHDVEHLGEHTNLNRAAIVVALSDTPLDQYLNRKGPEVIESAVNPVEMLLPINNPNIQKRHIIAALREFPATEAEIGRWLGSAGQKILKEMAAQQDAGENAVASYEMPQVQANGEVQMVRFFRMVDPTNKPLPGLETLGALTGTVMVEGREKIKFSQEDLGWLIYPGAVLTYAGQRFHVNRVDSQTNQAYAEALDTPLIAERIIRPSISSAPDGSTDPSFAGLAHTRYLVRGGTPVMFIGPLTAQVSEMVVGYQRYDSFTYGIEDFDRYKQPFQRAPFNTQVLVIGIPDATSEELHTLAHLIRTVTPAFFRVESSYEVVVSDQLGLRNGKPALVIYDSVPGGTGACEWMAKGGNLARLFEMAYDVLVTCPCTEGCRNCAVIHNCHTSEPGQACSLDKLGAIKLLGKILSKDTKETIEHRVKELTKPEAVNAYLRQIMDYIFPQKLGLESLKKYPVKVTLLTEPTPEDQCMYLIKYGQIRVRPMPEQKMILTLAHLCAHHWEWYGEDPMWPGLLSDSTKLPYFKRRLFTEAFAQWVEYKVADYFGFRMAAEDLPYFHGSTFSAGLKMLMWIENTYGAAKVTEFIRHGALTINEEVFSPEKIIDMAGLRAQLVEADRRFSQSPVYEDVHENIVSSRRAS